GKVFYVWFDAPIAYIAATQEWAGADPGRRDWRSWWWEADDVEYLQFLGKDNVPFHAVSFPATLIGSGEPWKTVDVIKGVNWLTYEGGKFSTSQRRGVFLDQALELLPADYWRWWLAANAPEGNDTDFTFGRFATDLNHDLADTFGNLVNRVLSFAATRYGGVIPEGGLAAEPERRLTVELDRRLNALLASHRALTIRKVADEVRSIWRLANGYVAAEAPWSTIESNPLRSAVVLRTALNLVHVAATAAWPIIPEAAARVLDAFGAGSPVPPWPSSATQGLARLKGGTKVVVPPVLFEKLSSDWVERQRRRFSGAA
ncbi:methionine--tRNA ligase, partial [Mesorhizobium sp. M5C.F.Ca.IN.020.14.1.1]